MAEPDMRELLARIQQLELAEARRAAAAAPIQMAAASHAPRPGTWLGDSREAECRYCGQRVWSDEQGRWFAGRDETCHARLGGAEARD